ncbi:MAG: porin [Planctomycetota bacterium]
MSRISQHATRHGRYVVVTVWLGTLLSLAVSVQSLAAENGLLTESAVQPSDQLVLSPDQTLRRIEQLEAIVAELGHRQPVCVVPASANRLATHYPVYDTGWTLRPFDAECHPFELTVGLHNQFRYTAFDRAAETSIDSAGNTRFIPNRNDFDINRGRLVFSGYAFDQDLGFYANIDYSTVASNPIQLLLSWMSFRLSDQFTLYAGLGKVPGTWEWQQTSRYTMGADRTLATTFFRPSITAGLWAIGDVTERLHYQALVGDGFNTFSLRAAELDTRLAYSGLVWWEPMGEFGVGFSDLEDHQSLALRLGHGLTQTTNESSPTDQPGPEQTVIRLTDGTRLVEPGALAAGVTVNAFDIWLYTAHLGIKYRGFSFSSELFLRWLRNLQGTGGTSLPSLFDQGFFVQASKFVVPKRVELFARGSQVHGDAGTGDELSAGVNWYLFEERSARFTFDVTSIDDSPAQQSRTGYVAGGSGTLLRAQLWTFF